MGRGWNWSLHRSEGADIDKMRLGNGDGLFGGHVGARLQSLTGLLWWTHCLHLMDRDSGGRHGKGAGSLKSNSVRNRRWMDHDGAHYQFVWHKSGLAIESADVRGATGRRVAIRVINGHMNR